ncbi:hypothetical protein [Pseudoxanthomonas sp.]|uniref:hypothetical protein n=1 Tax=Pseudoxanthomonas sp. TaxID=1871049 RepID=UPI0035B3D213
MCTYISAIVPKSADVDRLSAVAASFNKDFRPFANASIQGQLSPGELLFLTTRGHCDCDSALGSGNRRRRKVADVDEERSKLAKKGWSKSKIERSLAQRMDQIQKREQDHNSELGKDLENWLGFLRNAVSNKDTPYIALLAHHYSGSLAAEQFTVSNRQVVEATKINQESIANMAEDVIYQVTAHA